MIDGLIGVAVGAVFAPFWIAVWNKVKAIFTKTEPAVVADATTVVADVAKTDATTTTTTQA